MTDTPAKASPKSRGHWKWILFLIFLVFIGGVTLGLIYMPQLRERLPLLDRYLPPVAQAQSDRLGADLNQLRQELATLTQRVNQQNMQLSSLDRHDEQMTDRLDDMESRVSSIPETPAPEAPQPAQNKPEIVNRVDTARLDMLAARISQLESAFVPLAKKSELEGNAARDTASLRESLESLTKQVRQVTARLETLEAAAATDRYGSLLGLTLAGLERAVLSGNAFGTELNLMSDIVSDQRAPDDAAVSRALETLHPFAPEGLATRYQLNQSFARIANDVLRATAIPSDARWYERLWGRIKSLITIRETGNIQGNSPTAILARTEQRLAQDDLAGALDELSGLSGSAEQAATPWIAKATARFQAEMALENLNARLAEGASRALNPTANGTYPFDKGDM